MNRLFALGLVLMLLGGLRGGGLPAAPDAAARPAAANSRTLSFVQHYDGTRVVISGVATTDAPMACSGRLLLAASGVNSQTASIIANCRIAAGHRDGQRVTIRGTAAATGPGAPPGSGLRCRDAQSSDPETGKVKLRCEFPAEHAEPAA